MTEKSRHKSPDIPPVTAQDAILLLRFTDVQLVERGLIIQTINAYATDLRSFVRALATYTDHDMCNDIVLLRAEQSDIMHCIAGRVKGGRSARSAARLLSALRQFYAWAVRESLLSDNPAARVRSPGIGRPLSKTLTESQARALLLASVVCDDLGLRDRAMLEIVYGCGLRVTELVLRHAFATHLVNHDADLTVVQMG